MVPLNLSSLKEFIYELGGNYYRIGYSICEVCTDEKIIELFRAYREAISCDEFQDNKNKYAIQKFLRTTEFERIANTYTELLNACKLEVNEQRDEKQLKLMLKLENQYGDELKKQVSVFKKAGEIAGLNEIRHLE